MAKDLMTFYTYRNNVKPVFRRITVPVMILLSRVRAIITKQGFRGNQFTSCNGMTYSMVSLTSFRMAGTKANLTFPICCFAFFGFFIKNLSFPIYCFAFLGLMVLFHVIATTFSATMRIAAFSRTVFAEFGKQFDLFAFGTSFRYDSFRHLLLLIRSKCLESFASPVGALGLLYINRKQNNVN